jgi:leucyl aminopeptidase
MILVKTEKINDVAASVWLVDEINDTLHLLPEEREYISRFHGEGKKNAFILNRYSHHIYLVIVNKAENHAQLEKIRREGDAAALFFMKEQQESVQVKAIGVDESAVLPFIEGMALGSYHFSVYKSEVKKTIRQIILESNDVSEEKLNRLNNLVKAVYATRDLVNEPSNHMDAVMLAATMASKCREAGARVTSMGKKEIEELQMNALLTVNGGSQKDPSFTVIEWKPADALNQQPVVLVGKGLVFDTGGINIKPTEGLETMKSDMAGGAAVFGALYALALNKVPVYVIGLIPATDNRPGENAMVPSDVIRMKNGKTVEVVNTDAEGRLILADALIYAAQYNPSLVIDIATLTGAAQMAIGRFGMAGMHQRAPGQMKELIECGMKVHERIVEFPFWEDYDKEIESEIADIRNLGKGKGGGVITAGKFLAHFTDSPWIHLDIAPIAFLDARETYAGKGATGVGVRLLYDFIENKSF